MVYHHGGDAILTVRDLNKNLLEYSTMIGLTVIAWMATNRYPVRPPSLRDLVRHDAATFAPGSIVYGIFNGTKRLTANIYWAPSFGT